MTSLLSRAVPSLLAAALLLPMQGALASTTFLLDLRGQATHHVNMWECLPLCQNYPDPLLEDQIFDWIGVLTLVTASGANGVYTGGRVAPDGDLLAMSFESNLYDFGNPYTASATILDGQVVALQAYFEDAPIKLRLSGMTATYEQPPFHHFGDTRAVAIITNVPEPSTWALLALGLGGVAIATRRRRDRHSVQITFLRAPAHVS
jgi:PEP-CTERM motif